MVNCDGIVLPPTSEGSNPLLFRRYTGLPRLRNRSGSNLDTPTINLVPSKQLSSTDKRRLLMALCFTFVSVLRWNRDLNSIPSTATLPKPSATSLSPPEPLATAAYAVSITSCSSKLFARLFDAAAVLRRSIQLNSWPLHPDSRYAARFYAFTQKPNETCYQILTLAGWEVIPQDPPLYNSLIKEPSGSTLRNGIGGNGCCGSAELIKLATYKLTDHEMAVHLDLDTLVIHPLDELFNVMHFNSHTKEGKKAREQLGEVVAPTYLNRIETGNPSTPGTRNATDLLANITVNAYFSKDYNMIAPGPQSQRVGVQGGFLVVRPSTATFMHLVNLVYSGEFYGGFDAVASGWFKSGYGSHIWGAMTIQGLMAYYFDVEQLERSVELNRCRYNNIADNARVSTFSVNPKYPRGTLLPFVRNASNPRYNFNDKACRDGRASCDDTDCQRFPIEKARVLHYTYCKSPWNCNGCEYLETYKDTTCYAMLKEWFRVRRSMPQDGNRTLDDVRAGHDNGPLTIIQKDGEVQLTEGNCWKDVFLGYCRGQSDYVPLPQISF